MRKKSVSVWICSSLGLWAGFLVLFVPTRLPFLRKLDFRLFEETECAQFWKRPAGLISWCSMFRNLLDFSFQFLARGHACVRDLLLGCFCRVSLLSISGFVLNLVEYSKLIPNRGRQFPTCGLGFLAPAH